MTQDQLTEWDEDETLSADEEYEALVRAISWSSGFGLLFVDCSPSEGEKLVGRIQSDITQKTVDVLRLTAEIEDLQECVARHPNIQETQVLFITGLEKSLVEYIEAGYGSEGKYYAKDSIPKLLGRLNLQRESFKARFPLCFVFLVPHYAMKYLIRRAADFFDWRSGVWEFLPSEHVLRQETSRILYAVDLEQYRTWTIQQRQERCLEIDDLLSQPTLSGEDRASLLFEQGIIFAIGENYTQAIASYEKALKIKPNKDVVWYNRGNALGTLGRYEDAITSYNKALEIRPNRVALYGRGVAFSRAGRYEEAIASYDKIIENKPNDVNAWHSRGVSLLHLERSEKALANYDEAIAIDPNNDEGWHGKGISLYQLGRYEEAIASYDKALEIKPDQDKAWYNRGIALGELGRYEDAIASYDKVLKVKPDKDQAWYDRGIALRKLGRYEDAIASYDKALEIKNKDDAWYNRGIALGNLGRHEEAIVSYEKALELKQNKDEAWYNKGVALLKLERYEESIASYEKVLEIKPDDKAWTGKGLALAYLGCYEDAIASYEKALEIKPDGDNAIYNKACCYALWNKPDRAIEHLKKAIALNPENLNLAKTDSDFDQLREDPRFQAVLKQ